MRTADRFIAWRVLREKDFVKKEYRRAPSSVPCPHAIHLALDIVRQKRYRKSVSAYPLQVGKGRSGTGFKAESTILLRFRAPDASKRGARAYLSRDSYQFLARHVEIRQRKQRIDLRRFNSQNHHFAPFLYLFYSFSTPFLLLFYSFSTPFLLLFYTLQNIYGYGSPHGFAHPCEPLDPFRRFSTRPVRGRSPHRSGRVFFHKTRSTSWLLLRSAGNWPPRIPFSRRPHGASRWTPERLPRFR